MLDIAILESEIPGRPRQIGSASKLAIGDRITLAQLAPATGPRPRALAESNELKMILSHGVVQGFAADGQSGSVMLRSPWAWQVGRSSTYAA